MTSCPKDTAVQITDEEVKKYPRVWFEAPNDGDEEVNALPNSACWLGPA